MESKLWIIIVMIVIAGTFVFSLFLNWEAFGQYIHYHIDTKVYHVHKFYGRGLTPEQYDEVFDKDHDGIDKF